MMQRFTIGVKLRINSILIIFGLIISGVVVYNTLSSLSKEYKHSLHLATQNDTLKSVFINGLLYNSSSGVIFQNPNSKKAKNTMKNAITKLEKLLIKFNKLNPTMYKGLSGVSNDFLTIAKSLQDKVLNNKKLEKKDMQKSLKNWRKLKSVLSKDLKLIQNESKKSSENYNQMIEKSVITIAVFMFVISLIILAFNVFLSRSIIQPLEVLKEAIEKLSNKNSSSGYEKINISSKDETAKIAYAFNKYLDKVEAEQKEDNIVINDVQEVVNEIKSGKLTSRVNSVSSNQNTMALVYALNGMLDNLHDVLAKALETLHKYQDEDFRAKTGVICEGEICDLLNGIDSLGESISNMLVSSKNRGLELEASAKTLLQNVDVLNRSSNDAAASIEETAAAIEEITSIVTSSTEKIAQMSNLANEVTNAACEGQSLANKTTKSMDEINGQVTAINEAITVIDQIAFQTNILSLNAAVEAATAGEAGKGFAVVAGEVRNLAARSAEAASEIKTLVENANQKANEGKLISDEMIEGYSSLNDNIDKTIQLISDVSSSSKEQQTGIIQINDSVSALDQKTQENANIASQTQEVANTTQQIADDIVSDTQKKEFIGKE